MKVLVADDDPGTRLLLESGLTDWGYQVIQATDGTEAWEVLQREDAPSLAILDWMMPGMSGIEVTRRVRERAALAPTYVIILTGRCVGEAKQQDAVTALETGASDFVTKPFDDDELRSRVRVGERVAQLQTELAKRVKELEKALGEVKELKAILPICCYCKKIRDDQDYWHEVDKYISGHSQAHFSHGICPGCLEEQVKSLL